jgi:hypothetical protein
MVPFWQRKTLAEMNREEWESLCDGCARCCLNKIEYEDTGEIVHTNVTCRLLDPETCRCASYDQRKRFVPECQILTPQNLKRYKWLPPSCAYLRLSQGRGLAWWHPLVSGDADTVHAAGISVRGRTVSEREAKALEDHVVEWPGIAE